jgi:hypothetical protein
MAREHQKAADRRRVSKDAQPEPRRNGDGHENQSRDWYGSERENEFGGQGRFRADGGHGSHFGGDPEALGESRPEQPGAVDHNATAWSGERRRKFVEKFERWRSERAARRRS